MKLLHVTHKNCNCSELAEFLWFGDSSCDSYWSCRSGKSGVSGDLGDLDKSDGFCESGESIVPDTQVRHTRSSLHQPVQLCNFPTFVRPL